MDVLKSKVPTKNSSPSNIDPNQLMTTANEIVDKDQYQLRVEFERRQHILTFNAKDHRLVQTFYQLKPRLTEVRINHSNPYHIYHLSYI